MASASRQSRSDADLARQRAVDRGARCSPRRDDPHQ